ncbi:MAG: UDP-N-acetylmuramoyl-L-alanine--D-glutamate ligase, partial [Oscillospiraceae bacterium]
GVVITSEMEMFFELCPCEIIAVTGSDGKTTTTTLISELLKAEGYTVHLGGNIGRALLPIIEQVKPTDKAVVELSSFQLISMSQSPNIAVITNIAPNHLDVHKDMEEYINAKKNILLHQSAFSKAVLNLDNPSTIALAHFVRGKLEMFSRKNAVVHGAFVENNMIYYADDDKKTAVLNTKDIRIPGEHNIENYLAAITAVWNMVSIDTIKKVAKSFAGVEHRIEFIRELNGVKWYNDSIATSPTRTIAGLNSFNQKLIIIAGGYDKKIPFEPMAPIMLQKVKTLILTGATSPKIEAAIRNCNGFENSGMTILHAENLTDAVTIAAKTAVLGDIVSLSPACASFDCYPNFEQRGNHFKQLVRDLK